MIKNFWGALINRFSMPSKTYRIHAGNKNQANSRTNIKTLETKTLLSFYMGLGFYRSKYTGQNL